MIANEPSSSPGTIHQLPEHLYSDAIGLWERTGLSRPWNDPDADLHRALTGTTSTVLAAVEHEELLATAMVGHDGHRGCVYYLAVTPAAQGRGLGRRLMHACEQWIQARGIPKIQLMLRAENAPSPPSTSGSATPTPKSSSSADAWTCCRSAHGQRQPRREDM